MKGCGQKWLVILKELSEAFELFTVAFVKRARMMEIAQWMEEYAAIFPEKFPWQKEGKWLVSRLPYFPQASYTAVKSPLVFAISYFSFLFLYSSVGYWWKDTD